MPFSYKDHMASLTMPIFCRQFLERMHHPLHPPRLALRSIMGVQLRIGRWGHNHKEIIGVVWSSIFVSSVLSGKHQSLGQLR